MEEPLNEIKNQAGPCGIVCSSCPLGSGSVAEAAARTRKHIVDCQIPMWSPVCPLRRMQERRRPTRLHHQDLRSGEWLRAMQLLQ
ncbi:MAG: hypothetical protein WCG94_03320 [Methanothrix sp.]